MASQHCSATFVPSLLIGCHIRHYEASLKSVAEVTGNASVRRRGNQCCFSQQRFESEGSADILAVDKAAVRNAQFNW
jgi:hypothetical protein